MVGRQFAISHHFVTNVTITKAVIYNIFNIITLLFVAALS